MMFFVVTKGPRAALWPCVFMCFYGYEKLKLILAKFGLGNFFGPGKLCQLNSTYFHNFLNFPFDGSVKREKRETYEDESDFNDATSALQQQPGQPCACRQGKQFFQVC